MFKYIFLIAIFVPMFSSATKWVVVDGKDPSHLIDIDSIKKSGDLTLYRTKAFALSEYYSIFYYKRDCKSRLERIYKEERYENIGDKLLNTTTFHINKLNNYPLSKRNEFVCHTKFGNK